MKTLNKLIEFIMYLMPTLLVFGGVALIIYEIAYFIIHINQLGLFGPNGPVFLTDNAINFKLFWFGVLAIPVGLAWRHWTILWYEMI